MHVLYISDIKDVSKNSIDQLLQVEALGSEWRQRKQKQCIQKTFFKTFDGKRQKQTAMAEERCEAKGNWSVCLRVCLEVTKWEPLMPPPAQQGTEPCNHMFKPKS